MVQCRRSRVGCQRSMLVHWSSTLTSSSNVKSPTSLLDIYSNSQCWMGYIFVFMSSLVDPMWFCCLKLSLFWKDTVTTNSASVPRRELTAEGDVMWTQLGTQRLVWVIHNEINKFYIYVGSPDQVKTVILLKRRMVLKWFEKFVCINCHSP